MKRRRPTNDDCLRQCLARVLEMPVGKVPHFVRKHRGYWAYYMAAWLERRGYAFVIGNARACTFPGTRVRGGKFSRHYRRFILIGLNRRGRAHAVVAEASGDIVYDGGAPLKGQPSTFIAILRVSYQLPRGHFSARTIALPAADTGRCRPSIVRTTWADRSSSASAATGH